MIQFNAMNVKTIDDYAKDGGEEIVICLKNTVHPGKKFLAAIFSVIAY